MPRKTENSCTYLFGAPVALSDVLASFEHLKDLLHGGKFLLQLLHFQALSTPPGILNKLFMRLLDELDILDPEFLADDVQITDRVDIALHVDDLGVVETSHDLEDGIDGANV